MIKASKEETIFDPMKDELTGEFRVGLVVPILADEMFYGLVNDDVSSRFLQDMVDNIKAYVNALTGVFEGVESASY